MIINHLIIGTGDDCISVGPGSKGLESLQRILLARDPVLDEKDIEGGDGDELHAHRKI